MGGPFLSSSSPCDFEYGACTCDDILEAACAPCSEDPDEGTNGEGAELEVGAIVELDAKDVLDTVGIYVPCIGRGLVLDGDCTEVGCDCSDCDCSDVGEGANRNDDTEEPD